MKKLFCDLVANFEVDFRSEHTSQTDFVDNQFKMRIFIAFRDVFAPALLDCGNRHWNRTRSIFQLRNARQRNFFGIAGR